ncbi:DUF937 domain-containing protein [Bosea lathyri]|uniref:DUF937 domain-containing protein n=1 Tax=Bosea lathyri TaxID=1036778 RepID=A0A1H5T9Z0_9HYPH|nr:DUF937 domain-containing protein [Bosea lathyri]SEF58901.1 hypothetical protein SAMN04488115_101560 [Bosea lathyri]
MMNLFEMMQSAQNGQAMQNLARQYGLSQQQTQSAIEALLPAFSMGLQRQTQDPQAFGSLAQMMTASPFGNIFDARGSAIPPSATAAGNDVLSQLFGSKEVSQAVAAQAAATSGVSQAILKQMLPIIASMVMGGLVKSTSNQGLGGILGQFAEMMRGQMPGQQPAPQPQQQAPANPLDTIFGGMFGNAPPTNPGQAPGGQAGSAQPGANPFDGGMLGQILTGMLGGAQQPDTRTSPSAPTSRPAEPAEEEAPPPSSGPGPGSIGLDALNQMFEHGRQVQDDHQNALKSILDSMLGGGQSRR